MQKAHLHTNKRLALSLSKGFSLVEILVAISVFLVFVLATTGVIATTSQNARHTSNSERATVLAEEAIEISRNLRDANPAFATLPDGTYGLTASGNQWNLSGSSDTQGIFTRTVSISTINGSQKKVSTTVTWADQTSPTNSVTTNTYLTDWKAPLNGLTITKTIIGTPQSFLPNDLTTNSLDYSTDPPTPITINIPITFGAPGMLLVPGTYTFTTSNNPNYSLTMSPDCGGGSITLNDSPILCDIIYSEYTAPTIDTPVSSSITSTSATLGATVQSLGNPASISALGVCYSTSPDPSLTNGATCVAGTLSQTTPNSFTVSITGLVSGTTYYFVGYATNSTGTGYTSSGTFVTAGSGTICDTAFPNDQFYVCYFDGITAPTGAVTALNQYIETSVPSPVGTWAGFNHDWSTGEVDSSGQTETVSAVWRGNINFQAGNYVFHTMSDDGIELNITGFGNVISNWTVHAAIQNNSSTIFIPAGYRNVQLRWYENTTHAVARLWWDYTPPSTITYVGSATAGGTTASIPAHNVGDLLVAFAYRDGSVTPPTVPAGWTIINSGNNGNLNSSVLAYRIATGVEPGAGWSNASEIIVQAYRGVSASPIGINTSQNGSGVTVTYPALSPSVTNGTSWIIGFAGHRSINTNLQNAPTGMIQRSTRVDATAEVSGHDTNAGVSSWTAKNVSVGGTSSGWMTRVLEIKSQ